MDIFHFLSQQLLKILAILVTKQSLSERYSRREDMGYILCENMWPAKDNKENSYWRHKGQAYCNENPDNKDCLCGTYNKVHFIFSKGG